MTVRQAMFAAAATLPIVLGTGCTKTSQDDRATKTQTKTADSRKTQATSPAPRLGHAMDGEGRDHDHDQTPPPKATLPTDGRLGEPLTIDKATPLDKLLANPKSFEAKTIRVTGKVVAMCRHRRAWFALGDKGGKPAVMVRTAPKFFVPPVVMGMKASAEGIVQIKTFPQKVAAHLAQEHKLFGGDPKAIDGPRTLVTIQAKGARFSAVDKPGKTVPRK